MENVILETERLWLRELTWDDFEEVHAMNNDPEMMRFMGGVRPDQELLKTWLQKNFFDYYQQFPGLGVWPAVLKETGEFLGWCGLKHQGFNPKNEIEIGYRVKKKFWRKGFASEMANGVLQYGLNDYGLSEISAVAQPKNFCSRKVLENC